MVTGRCFSLRLRHQIFRDRVCGPRQCFSMQNAFALEFKGMVNPFVAIKSACGESKYAKYVVEIHPQLWVKAP
jgi:hypothetical protein